MLNLNVDPTKSTNRINTKLHKSTQSNSYHQLRKNPRTMLSTVQQGQSIKMLREIKLYREQIKCLVRVFNQILRSN